MDSPRPSATDARATTVDAQLKRLEKIKALTEDGHPISSLIELSKNNSTRASASPDRASARTACRRSDWSART